MPAPPTPREGVPSQPKLQLHNRVHVWVGGNMLLMTSPDDPVFFLHHCFIDKVSAEWQELQKINNPDGAPHYAPMPEGPAGHNIDDDIRPGAHTIRQVLDTAALDYTYEQPQTHGPGRHGPGPPAVPQPVLGGLTWTIDRPVQKGPRCGIPAVGPNHHQYPIVARTSPEGRSAPSSLPQRKQRQMVREQAAAHGGNAPVTQGPYRTSHLPVLRASPDGMRNGRGSFQPSR